MTSDELLYAIALRSCPAIGDVTFRKLVRIAGSANAAWNLSKKEINHLQLRASVAKGIGVKEYLTRADRELEYCSKNGIAILYSEQKQLPGLLSECNDAPVILYQRGNFHRNRRNLSIVGTRSLTAYGHHFIKSFLRALRNRDIQTISGLALGADTACHEESLQNNMPTIAVVAHGLDKLYPSKNRKLLERILENGGGILSEYPTFAPFVKENFIQRNRIIAGISPVTIVAETAFGGGSMSTANFANIYNREVLALPGNIENQRSQGCNLLIAQNKARIIVDVSNTIEYLGLEQSGSKQLNLFETAKDYSTLTIEQNEIIQVILNHPNITLDDLSIASTYPIHQILPILLQLELEGFIESTSGRQYKAK